MTLLIVNNDEHVVNFRGIETLVHDKKGLVSELSLLYELATREQEVLLLDQSVDNQGLQECNEEQIAAIFA